MTESAPGPTDPESIDEDIASPVSPLVRAVRAAFDPGAPLAAGVSDFRHRDSQLALAESISRAIDREEALVAEAGTGTGKTFAYLVPALLSGKRVLISTGTKTLQDQLYNRDLPTVLAALGVGMQAALLKGRSNYVCHHHLARNLADGRFARRQDVAVLHRIDRFASISRTGDRAEAPGIAEDAPAWVHATSTRDNCLGQDCEYLDKCFVLQARRRALQADVVVINHHLFCADLALRDDGVSELLPKADLMIFDEAHQLPETATLFFGQTVSTRQIVDFARELARVGRADAPDGADWLELGAAVEQGLRELRLAAGATRRIDEAQLRQGAAGAMLGAWDALLETMVEPVAALELNQERSRDLERLGVRGKAIVYSVKAWLAEIRGESAPEKPALPEDEPLPISSAWEEDAATDAPDAADAAAGGADKPTDTGAVPAGDGGGARDAGDASADVQAQVDADADVESDSDSDSDDPAIYWVDVHRQGLSLHRTPLAVSKPFRRQRMARPSSWIFTSATLSVGRRFDHFVQALGLEQARCERHDSPFSFETQGLLYVPQGLPDPRSPAFAAALADAIAPLIEANGGRAFVLCTSLRMVEAMTGLLQARLGTAKPAAPVASAWEEPAPVEGFELLVQGTDSRDVLLHRFRKADRPVLIGSASFWEGVDVVGAQLSLVVIDKLPFAPPDDPVVAARAKQLRARGEEPFMKLHLPHAAMALKQGAGRLIRSEDDRGLLVIGDTRLAEKPYGRRLVASLPPFRRTRDAAEAMSFLTDKPAEA